MAMDPVELWFVQRYGLPPGRPLPTEQPGSPAWHERERQRLDSDRLESERERGNRSRTFEELQRRELERRRLDRRY